jgi:3' terminal RNA ribose 2'-O-methyltransferase Hen1
LRDQRGLTREAIRRLSEDDDIDPDAREMRGDLGESNLERPLNLNQRRMLSVVEALREVGASRVCDLGCGEGRLLELLVADPRFSDLLGLDVSVRALERAAKRLGLESMTPRQRERIRVVHGSVTYRDERISGWDAATAIEVIEHLDPYRLDAFSNNIFGFAKPSSVVITTPNAEYNALFPALGDGKYRHPDHRFEWSRDQFHRWAGEVADRFSYSVSYKTVGDEHPVSGAPTQMAVFTR